VPVRGEALQSTDRYWFQFCLRTTEQAGFFAIKFMLTNPPTDSREGILPADSFKRRAEVAVCHLAHERLDIDVQRTGIDAFEILTVETAEYFDPNLVRAKTE
jgi:hypothetical protein